MAITKTGNVLLSVPIHIAQNQIMKRMLGNKTFHKGLWQHFYNGATGNTRLSRDAAKMIHIGGPVVPEIKIMANEAYDVGKKVSPYFTAQEPDLRSLVKMRRIARGKFTKAIKRPMNDSEMTLAKALYGKYAPNGNMVEFEKTLRTLTPEKAAELEALAQKNPLTGKLLKGVVGQSRMPSPRIVGKDSIGMAEAAKRYGLPAEVAVNGTLLAADPTTFAINAGKRALFSKELGNKYKAVKKVQNFGNDVLTNNPIKNALRDGGVKKKNIFSKAYDNFINPEIVNPVNAYSIDLAEGIGKIRNTP